MRTRTAAQLITPDKLARVSQAEQALRALGFRHLRVRHLPTVPASRSRQTSNVGDSSPPAERHGTLFVALGSSFVRERMPWLG